MQSAGPPTTAPVLSTPDTRIFEASNPSALIDQAGHPRPSLQELCHIYEIERTIREIHQGEWKRIALQFPDDLLIDAPRVSSILSKRLNDDAHSESPQSNGNQQNHVILPYHAVSNSLSNGVDHHPNGRNGTFTDEKKVFILADTSYGACCVDEIAAEHANADVVVHYGRSCLSLTSRIPVIYCFTCPPLGQEDVALAFENAFPDREQKTILMADLPYQYCLPLIGESLHSKGYINLFVTSVLPDTSALLPNRSVPVEAREDNSKLRYWSLFHVSSPPPALLLMLSSRVGEVRIFLTHQGTNDQPQSLLATSTAALRRRYALTTSLAAVPLFGILINTLSVRNYMRILNHVKDLIASAGKKSYTFVVGKVNPAKIANFNEVGGWVVIGCWESSLFDSKDFWKPIITPFELELALQDDATRVWSGSWTSDFQGVLDEGDREEHDVPAREAEDNTSCSVDLEDSEDESEPPEFDLHSGRYVSRSRPTGSIRKGPRAATTRTPEKNQSLMKKFNGDLTAAGESYSPAAECFKEKRSWQGLGSDFDPGQGHDSSEHMLEGAVMERGRHGIARGYQNNFGDDAAKPH